MKIFDHYCILEKNLTSFTMQKIQDIMPFEINWSYHLVKLNRKLGEKLSILFPDASMHIDPHKIFTREVMSAYEKGKEHGGRAQKCESFPQTEPGKILHMQTPERCSNIHYFS